MGKASILLWWIFQPGLPEGKPQFKPSRSLEMMERKQPAEIGPTSGTSHSQLVNCPSHRVKQELIPESPNPGSLLRFTNVRHFLNVGFPIFPYTYYLEIWDLLYHPFMVILGVCGRFTRLAVNPGLPGALSA